jgi:hypothetical protein
MVIDFRVSKVFKRQVLELLHSFVGRELTALHLLEEFLDLISLHSAISLSLTIAISVCGNDGSVAAGVLAC